MNVIGPEEHQKLMAAFRTGLSIRSSAVYAGVHRKTAQSYFHQQPPMTCPCGAPLPHKFWCSFRVSLSPGRQSFLKRFAPVRPETLKGWGDMKVAIERSLKECSWLCSVDHAAVAELRRFYQPPQFGLEFRDERPCLVAIAEATQEHTSFSLFAALEQLHPAVKRFVLALIDGANISEASTESGISDEALVLVMPRLKVFLRPYLT